MSQYQELREQLQLMARTEDNLTKHDVLMQAAGLLGAADCLLASVRGAARFLGYEGDDYQEAFYFIQDRGAEVLEATRANEHVAHAKEVRTKMRELVAFIDEYEMKL